MFDIGWSWAGGITLRQFYSRPSSPEYTLDRRLAGWISYCLGTVVNGHSFAPLGNEPPFFWRPTCGVITMLTELTNSVCGKTKHAFTKGTCGDNQVR